MWNRAVTGDPLRMPYVEYERQYAGVPLFILQAPKAPPLLNAEMATIHRMYLGQYRRTRAHPSDALETKAMNIAHFVSGFPPPSCWRRCGRCSSSR